MAVTYIKSVVVAHWDGDGADYVDDETFVHFWLDLDDQGDEAEAIAALPDILATLDRQELDWDDGVFLGSTGVLSIPIPGSLMIGVRSSTTGVAPLQYLDALCANLTQRGWSGQLRVHHEADRPWVPYDPSPRSRPCSDLLPGVTQPQSREFLGKNDRTSQPSWPGWQWSGSTRLRDHSSHFSEVSWRPTSLQAFELLKLELDTTADIGAELGRLVGVPRNEHEGLVPGSRVGRTAVLRDGYLTLTDNDPTGDLADRLSNHVAVLASAPPEARYGLTTGTVGHGRSPGAVYGERLEMRGQRVDGSPHQRNGYSSGVPDAYFAQRFPTDMLVNSSAQLDEWRRQDLDNGMTLLTSLTPSSWFTSPPAPDDPRSGWMRHDADVNVLGHARDALGDFDPTHQWDRLSSAARRIRCAQGS